MHRSPGLFFLHDWIIDFLNRYGNIYIDYLTLLTEGMVSFISYKSIRNVITPSAFVSFPIKKE